MKKQTWKMHFNKGVPKLIRGNNLLETDEWKGDVNE